MEQRHFKWLAKERQLVRGRVKTKTFMSPGPHLGYFPFYFFSFELYLGFWAIVTWIKAHHYWPYASRLCFSLIHLLNALITEMFGHSTIGTVIFSFLFLLSEVFHFTFLFFSKTNDEKCMQSCHLICQQNLPTCCNCSAVQSRRVRNIQRLLSLSTMEMHPAIWTRFCPPHPCFS